MKFGQTRVENMRVDSKVVDWREVQRLSTLLYPWLQLTAWSTSWFTFMLPCASRHRALCHLVKCRSFFTSPSSSLYLPLHLTAENLFGALYNPLSSGRARTIGCLFSVCSEFCQSYVLCIRMKFASRLLLSQLFDKSQTQGQVLTGSNCDDLTGGICIFWVASCNYGAF